MAEELSILGLKIKQYRKMHNMTQEDLALILNVEPEHIANIERGRKGISLQKLILLCKHFHINLSDILPIENQDNAELRDKWIKEILSTLENLDTTQLGIVKMMVTSLIIE